MVDKNQEKLENLIRVYREVFGSDQGKMVLEDLQKRCFHRTTTFDPDPRIHAFQEGSRAVFLTIDSMLSLDLEKIRERIANQEEGE